MQKHQELAKWLFLLYGIIRIVSGGAISLVKGLSSPARGKVTQITLGQIPPTLEVQFDSDQLTGTTRRLGPYQTILCILFALPGPRTWTLHAEDPTEEIAPPEIAAEAGGARELGWCEGGRCWKVNGLAREVRRKSLEITVFGIAFGTKSKLLEGQRIEGS